MLHGFRVYGLNAYSRLDPVALHDEGGVKKCPSDKPNGDGSKIKRANPDPPGISCIALSPCASHPWETMRTQKNAPPMKVTRPRKGYEENKLGSIYRIVLHNNILAFPKLDKQGHITTAESAGAPGHVSE